MANTDESTPLPGIMPDRLPETARAPDDFKPGTTAKTLLRTTRAATLATLDRNTGHPFSSLVNVATDSDGSPLILISRLATHTANLEVDPRASVLLASTGKGDPLAHPRLTVLGAFHPITRDAADAARIQRRFLSRHPKSSLYAGFADFSFWRMTVVSAHLNSGFARAADLDASTLLTRLDGADEIIAIEESAVAHMNTDHADAVQRYARKWLGDADGTPTSGWRATGIDPDGIDLTRGDDVARLPFTERVTTPDALRRMLAALARPGQ